MVDAFFAEAKHNRTIHNAVFDLPVTSLDDLSDFIRFNQELKFLTLALDGLSLNESTILSMAISSPQLDTVGITNCRFENDGSLERILRGCTRLNSLRVGCEDNLQLIALAAFLRGQANVKNLK
jgi:hypothetical protein